MSKQPVQTKDKKPNRYAAIIEKIFVSRYKAGDTEVDFERAEFESFAGQLGIQLPKNLGDIIYSFRYRTNLPSTITSKAPKDHVWIIRPTGRGKYRMIVVKDAPIVPNLHLEEIKVPDSTPGVVAMYSLDDEQALLARVRYNRLIDIFTGVTCYSLQNHLRTTVPEMGQVETDEIYIGLNRHGAHYVFPIQAKGGTDRLNAITPLVTHNLNSLFVGSNGLNNLERQGVEREEQLRQLYNISTDFATNYNAQPYSGWTLLTNDQFSLNEFLIDLALYDRFYSFAQFRASDIRETVIAIFSWITPAFEAKLQWTVQHAAHVVEALVSAQSPKLQPHVVSIEHLLAACSEVPEAEFHRILDLLSYTNHGENEAILPEFSEALALTSKPLVKSKDGSYVLLATSVATASSIEPIAHDVYRHDRKAYEKIGLSIELFLRRRIEHKAIPVLSGIYRIAGQDGECDAIIETPETIIFLELKLKSLTRLARSGQDIEIFIDLSKSLFAALKQLNQHEILLRRHGKLQLKRNDGSTSQIDLNGRTIEKVALTFDDFGSFQDRNVLTQILGILMNVSLGTDKVERRSELEKLNIQVAAIRKQIATLQELNPAMSKIPFFNCWFLSVPQLLTLLDEVSSPQSFKEELWSIRHVTHVSLDAYVELTAARQMRRSAH